MEPRVLIIATACFSSLVPSVRLEPVTNVVVLGAAVGAIKGAIKGAALASAGSIAAKGIATAAKEAVPFFVKKAFSASASKGPDLKGTNWATKKGIAKTTVHDAALGAVAAIGGVVAARKPFFVKHQETLNKPCNVPTRFAVLPWLRNFLHGKTEAEPRAVFPVRTYEIHKEQSAAYQAPATPKFFFLHQ